MQSIWLQIVLSVSVSLLLAIYAVLRTVFAILPIQAIRERLIGSIDRFLQEWAGDMRVLLLDETQAGMVRFRIARSIRALQAYGCNSIVVVAHSGGAVASYMTLTDERYADLPVRTFITYGSGLNIAWRLLGFTRRTPKSVVGPVGGRLGRKLPAHIMWHDFWATDDPVPAGPVDDAPGSVSRPPRDTRPPHDRGRRVNNRWNLIGDHGTYFDNDEEFLVPLAESIDDQVRPPDAARLFAHWPEPARTTALDRRLERVATLSLWRRWAAACGILAIFGAATAGLLRYWWNRPDGLSRPLEDLTTFIERTIGDFLGDALPGEVGRETGGPADAVQGGIWLADSLTDWLTVTGHVGWIGVVGALAVLLLPELVDWGRAWRREPRMGVVVWIVAGFLAFVLLLTVLLGIPGLLGASLASSPVWTIRWFVPLREGFMAWASSVNLDFAFSNAALNFLIAAAFFVMCVVVIWLMRAIVNWSRKSVVGSIAADVVLMALSGWILVSLVFTAVVSGAFRSNLLGWAILLLAFAIINRVGQWRWSQWDELERWQQRAAIAGVAKDRRAGRRLDAAVFTILAFASLVAAVGIAIRPLFVDAANIILIVAGVALVAGVFVGLAQDEVNGRIAPPTQGLPGESPTPVSQMAKAS